MADNSDKKNGVSSPQGIVILEQRMSPEQSAEFQKQQEKEIEHVAEFWIKTIKAVEGQEMASKVFNILFEFYFDYKGNYQLFNKFKNVIQEVKYNGGIKALELILALKKTWPELRIDQVLNVISALNTFLKNRGRNQLDGLIDIMSMVEKLDYVSFIRVIELFSDKNLSEIDFKTFDEELINFYLEAIEVNYVSLLRSLNKFFDVTPDNRYLLEFGHVALEMAKINGETTAVLWLESEFIRIKTTPVLDDGNLPN